VVLLPRGACAAERIMKKGYLLYPLALFACGGDDITNGPADAGREAAPFDGSFSDTAVPEAGAQDAGNDAPPPPPRLLLTINGATSSETIALNLGTGAVDGRLPFNGFGTTFARGDDPWVMEQLIDVVAKLDRAQPWKPVSSWSVALNDKKDGGDTYADPSSVISAGNKAYVLRYTRNQIAVVDPSQTLDGGAPTKTIDLSSLVQAQDKDGLVDMTAGYYLSGKLYVLLGNIDKTLISAQGIACAPTTETLIAIDTTTDQVVSLGGSGPGGGFPLTGYNPTVAGNGPGFFYDAAGSRFLVVHYGCQTPLGDGGLGTTVKRTVEQIDLAGQTKVLLDASGQDYPGAFEYVGAHDAYIGFGFANSVLHWDPTKTTLDPALPYAPGSYAFVYDGQGSLLGTRTNVLADGGFGSLEVIATQISDGGTRVLATNPFTDNTGFVQGAELWPHR
jgi:hypothetical protein